MRTKPGASIEGIELTIMLECAATSFQGVSLDQVESAGVEHIEFQRKKKTLETETLNHSDNLLIDAPGWFSPVAVKPEKKKFYSA